MASRETVLRVIAAGASVDVSEQNFGPDTLVEFATAAAQAGKTLVVTGGLSPDNLERIVQAGGGCVTVKFN